MAIYYHNLENALRDLHYNYGKGDIIDCHYEFNGMIVLQAKRTSCAPHTARGTCERLTPNKYRLNMYGHQRTVTIV